MEPNLSGLDDTIEPELRWSAMQTDHQAHGIMAGRFHPTLSCSLPGLTRMPMNAPGAR